ncbi:DUF3558 domain-containing protein [Nocardia sp. CDC159]|uniref:DUF3558 domain-containing protein n=1 Tax=Nocardia pulmonis TaxID=2951408 RepID=A0A9X2J0I3_9NOCA|nr:MULTISPECIES: DUF3558 family protein [Nocardia]MCM6777849.1 DUF3558 domain-containing protein [Nocardia pulmonis]MCM6790733.1 DUF3558 domain-containing protein [Nocardia sp. CDC159]
MRMVRLAAVALVLFVAAGCASGAPQSAHKAPAEVNQLDNCGPLADTDIAKLAHAESVHPQGGPIVCGWEGEYPDGGGIVDITYAWLAGDSLLRESQVAAEFGYRTEHLVLSSFGGLLWRDPRDPGSCGVSAADSGTVTYWVQNRSHAAEPDPCAAATELVRSTVKLDG